MTAVQSSPANECMQAYGGDSYLTRLHRTVFSARTGLEDMWQGNPVLTTLLFGLPLGFLSLIMYSVCCGDIMDADDDDDQGVGVEEYERRMKKGKHYLVLRKHVKYFVELNNMMNNTTFLTRH